MYIFDNNYKNNYLIRVDRVKKRYYVKFACSSSTTVPTVTVALCDIFVVCHWKLEVHYL